MLRLIAQISHLRDARLHAEGHLIVVDAILNLRVRCSGKLMLMQLLQAIQHQPAAVRAHTRRIAEIQHRILRRSKQHALMPRRQKAAAPQVRPQRLPALALRDQHRERRQIRVLRTKTIAQPRPKTRPPRDLRSRLEKRHAGAVIDRLREHRPRHADVVRDACRVRQQFAEPSTRLPMLRELERRSHHRNRRLIARHPRKPLTAAHRVRKLLAVALVQHRLVIKQVEMRRPAGHEQINDALRLRLEMRACPAPHDRPRPSPASHSKRCLRSPGQTD
jgi:hypothetical protein